jgi:hypothetical protein
MEYDSKSDTIAHIMQVGEFIHEVIDRLKARTAYHDQSKLVDPEKKIFDEYTPKLKGTTYGSEEYKQYLTEMNVALKHHYENNRHHPEHFKDGVNEMTLVDLIEMLCDWKAATLRHADGSMIKSLVINRKRFGISDQLQSVLDHTVSEFGWRD